MLVGDELLKTVKLSLSILDSASDGIITQKIAEAADYLKSRGVSETQLATPTGTAAITLYVNDFWIVGGKAEESPAFWSHLSALYSNSRAEELKDGTTA